MGACTRGGRRRARVWLWETDGDCQRTANGGVSQDSEGQGKRAYKALVAGGSSGFNAVLGGGRSQDGQFARLQAHGFYWTASEIDPNHSWYYNFARGGLALNRQYSGEKERAFSVRCVKD
jgi:uncharacterized protein (TIGR02145 family)